MVEARGPEAGRRGAQVADHDIDGALEAVRLDILPAEPGEVPVTLKPGDDASFDAACEA